MVYDREEMEDFGFVVEVRREREELPTWKITVEVMHYIGSDCTARLRDRAGDSAALGHRKWIDYKPQGTAGSRC